MTFTTADTLLNAYKTQGSYRSDGETMNERYIVGTDPTGNQYHDYFSFDLSSLDLSGLKVTDVALEVQRYSQSASPVQLTLHSVADSVTTLTSGTPSLAVYNDLVSGAAYGQYTLDGAVSPVEYYTGSGDLFTFDLGTLGVSDATTKAGDWMSIGGSLDTPKQYTFNYSGGYAAQLIVTTAPVPEPSTFAFTGFGILGAILFRRKKA